MRRFTYNCSENKGSRLINVGEPLRGLLLRRPQRAAPAVDLTEKFGKFPSFEGDVSVMKHFLDFKKEFL